MASAAVSIHDIAEAVEPEIASNVQGALDDHGRTIIALAAQVDREGLQRLAEHPPVQVLEAALSDALEPLDGVYHRSAALIAGGGGPPPPDRSNGSGDSGGRAVIAVRFDAFTPSQLQVIAALKADMVREISAETMATISARIRDALRKGLGPPETARLVRDVVGLTDAQAQWVENYRAQLESLNAAALDRALRDRRSDVKIQRAIDRGEAMAPADIDALVERYRDRMVKFRSVMIARTESLRAANDGGRLGIEQVIDRGHLDRDRVRRFWIATHDSRTRPDHLAIPELNAAGVGFDEPFKLPRGETIMAPLDPDAPAREVVGCRCTLAYASR